MKSWLCTHCVSTLLKFTENVNSYGSAEAILQGFVESLVESGLADKCVVLAEEPQNPGSRIVASSGLASGELKVASSYLTDRARELEEVSSTKNTPVVVMRDRHDMDTLLSCVRGKNCMQLLIFSSRSDKLPQFTDSDIGYMSVLVNILRIAMSKADLPRFKSSTYDRISEAKRQWESSVDSMSRLMCLLDDNGRLLRANRTLEKWGLGDVRSVRGYSVHEMLHPECKDANCELDAAWKDLWTRSEHSRYEVIELYDPNHDSYFRLTVKRTKDMEMGGQFIVLIIEDISETKREAQLLEAYTEELYRKIQHQSLQLSQANTALMDEVNSRHQTSQSLEKSQAQLKTLSEKLLIAHEEERKRIAAELHDGIGQSISAIKFGLENSMLARDGDASMLFDDKQLGVVVSRLQAVVEEIRRISMGLRPAMLDDLGLLPTLNWFFREYQGTYENIRLKVLLDFEEEEMSSVRKLAIFRVTQEALNNIGKYSQADTVAVELRTSDGQLALLIEDNGKGFAFADEQVLQGFGLGSMKERAKMSGGTLEIKSTVGKGTTIRGVWAQP